MYHVVCHHWSRVVLLTVLLVLSLCPLLPCSGVSPTPDVDDDFTNPLVHSCAALNQQRRLYVSTVDGMLTAMDSKGKVLWTHASNEPLFTSSLSHRKSIEDVPDLIPSLDKSLYHWDGNKLQQLPFTADDLIDRSHKLGSALAGAKSREVVGVNIHTGERVYECSHVKCHRYDNQSRIQNIDVLKITTSQVTVREANEHTGEEMWNFTVGDLQLSLVEGVDDGPEFSCDIPPQPHLLLQVDTVKGILYAVNSDSEWSKNYIVWERKLSAPVVNVWRHEGGHLETIDFTSHHSESEELPNSQPQLMLVLFHDQYYIQPVAMTHEDQQLVHQHHQVHELKREEPYYPKIFSLALQPQHKIPSDSNPDESMKYGLAMYYDDDTFLKMCTSGPHGPAIYFHMDENVQQYDHCSSAEENGSGVEKSCPLPPSSSLNTTHEPVNERYWLWRFLYSVIKYVLFGGFVLGLNKLHRYHKLKRSPSGSHDDDFPLLEHMYSTLARNGSSSTSRQLSSSSNSSTESLLGSGPKPLERTLSRFGSDYELKGRLGKGGFGVVYHVRNKTDDGEYAIKRIKLPNSKSAREKVMREVHALAQLDHPRIVRYFHSWVEKAPSGWDEMEEWIPLSRRHSIVSEMGATATGTTTWTNTKSQSIKPVHVAPAPKALNGVDLSPCPSFASLNHSTIHSVVPPRFTADSRSSSFVIEFADESTSHKRSTNVDPEGCFNHTFLMNRDDLSTSTGSESTESQDDERRDSITALGAEPPTYLFIQMQLCQKESLKEWLATNIHNRRRENIMHFFTQILEAVLYVHRKGMMHRDLKPSNIFFSLDGNIKVGDFGLVTGTAFGALHNSYVALLSLADRDDHRQHTGNIGSHLYMSPELMSGLKYDQKVDIFSLGIIFFELHYPFSTEMERTKVLEDLRNQKFPPRFKTHLPLEAEFVEWLTAAQASDRPSAKEISSSDRLKSLRENAQRAEVGIIPKL